MQKQFPMRVPEWVKPEDRQLFVLRLAAVYHNPKGSIALLSEAMGGSRTLLHMTLNDRGNGLNANHCIKLEEILGRELFPREFFRPDIFIPA